MEMRTSTEMRTSFGQPLGIGAGAIELAGARAPQISESRGTGGTTEFLMHSSRWPKILKHFSKLLK